MRERIDRAFEVAAAPAEVWPRLLDVQAVASWLPIMHSVREVSPSPSAGGGLDGSSFRAAFEDKVGPFSLGADLLIEVAGVREPSEVSIRARGEDRQIRSRIKIDAACWLSAAAEGTTRVELVGSYEITGRVATLGAGVIRSKAAKLIDSFCANAARGLAGAE